ncbi:hypothetical protein ACIA8O_05925 [Kitasatospora sp. NPDC051853]|uniref:hypothetical protein n=1 Tax=Kitasatospora sp. NPDC051853 TaxID=3364058 RepID=UPI0037933F4A
MTNSGAGRRALPTSPFKSQPEPVPKEFAVGDRVSHDQYGLGRVIAVETGPERAALVDCGDRKVRVCAPYTRLFKL